MYAYVCLPRVSPFAALTTWRTGRHGRSATNAPAPHPFPFHMFAFAGPLSLFHRFRRLSLLHVCMFVHACERLHTFFLAYVCVLQHKLTGPLPLLLPTTQRLAATANQGVGASVLPIPLVCVGAMSAATLLTTSRTARALWGYVYVR